MGFEIRDYIPDQQIKEWLRWIEQNPTTFIYYVIIVLTPFLGLSAFLSWKLSKEMQKEAKEKKQKESRTKAILAAKDRIPAPASQIPTKGSKDEPQSKNGAAPQVKHIKKKKK